MDQCPGNPEKCRCPLHHPGLLAYSRNPAELRKALEHLKPSVLRVVDQGPVCTGDMLCECPKCSREKATRRPIDEGPAAFRVKPSRLAA